MFSVFSLILICFPVLHYDFPSIWFTYWSPSHFGHCKPPTDGISQNHLLPLGLWQWCVCSIHQEPTPLPISTPPPPLRLHAFPTLIECSPRAIEMNGEAGEDAGVWFGRAVQHCALTLLHTSCICNWYDARTGMGNLSVASGSSQGFLLQLYMHHVFQIKAESGQQTGWNLRKLKDITDELPIHNSLLIY